MSWSTWAFHSAETLQAKLSSADSEDTPEIRRSPHQTCLLRLGPHGTSNHGYALRPLRPERHNISQRSIHPAPAFRSKQLLRSGRIRLRHLNPKVFHAKAVVLATGGCGKIYKTTSNGFASTGDGFALAFDAFLPLEDMEFVQFHPTGIYGLGILISEAARAEGGVLRNGLGERFMERYAPTLKDLAPRDIVSRAILREISEGKGIDGKDYVYLDLRETWQGTLKPETSRNHIIRQNLLGN